MTNKLIKEGTKLRRIVDGRAARIGHEYTVFKGNWAKSTNDGNDLIADGGFIKELLTNERLKEYEIIDN